MMTEVRGASNAKAKRELGWEPRPPDLARGLPGGGRVSTGHDALLAELRDPAFAIAYRMLGSVAEAEDVVQETLLRVHRSLEGDRSSSRRARSRRPWRRGWRSTGCARPRARRERYTGEWLPEPIVTGDEDDPARQRGAGRLALDGVPRAARAAVARAARGRCSCATSSTTATARSPASSARARPTCASSPSRARRHVAEQRPRFEASREQRDELARRFFAATQDGDLGALEALLAHDVELHGDGGGKVPALARALRGRSRVARALVAWARAGPARPRGADAACRDQRPARRAGPGRLGRRARRDGARHRGRADPGGAVRGQPRQARATSAQVGDMRALLGTAADGGTFLAGPRARGSDILSVARCPSPSPPPPVRRASPCSAGARPSPSRAMSARRTCPTATCWPHGSPRRSTAAG